MAQRDEYCYFVTIEGLGKASAVAASEDDTKLWRLATQPLPAALDPDGLIKPWWAHSGDKDHPFRLPTLTTKMDYRTGKFTIADTMFSFVCVSGDSDLDLQEALLYPFDPPVVGVEILKVDGPTDTSLTLRDLDGNAITTMAGQEIGIKRERIVLGSHIGSGIYTGCKRAAHGTPVTAHDPARPGEDMEVFTLQSALQNRRVALWAISMDATDLDADAELLWPGVLQDTGYTQLVKADLECRGLTSLLGNVTLGASDWQGQITYYQSAEQAGSAATRQLKFKSAPSYIGGTPTLPVSVPMDGVLANGDRFLVRIKDSVYFAEAIRAVGEFHFWVKDLDRPEFDTPPLNDGDVVVGDVAVRELWWAHPDAPPIYDRDVTTLGETNTNLGGASGDFITALEQVLTSTRGGGNGRADIVHSFGVGYPAHLLDTDSWDAARHALGPRAVMDRVFVGGYSNDDAPSVADWAEQHMAAMGVGFTTSDNGLLGLEVLTDLAPYGVTELSISDADILEDSQVSASSGLRDVIDIVGAVFARTPTGKTKPLNVNNILSRQRTLGPRNRQTLDLGGYGNQGMAWSAANRYINRWARKTLVLEFGLAFSKRVRLGAGCKLTSAQVVFVDDDGNKVEGCTNARVVVQQEAIAAERHRRVYTGRVMGRPVRRGYIPPFAVVADPPGSGTTWNLEANVAQPSDGGVLARDSAQFAAGDVLKLCDEYGTSRATNLVVASVGTNTITFTGTPSPTPNAGDIFVVDDYDRQSSSQQEQWITIADRSSGLGSTPDAGFRYGG